MLIEGRSFHQVPYNIMRSLKLSVLSLQNIDDRFKFNWNNIRYDERNERNIRDKLKIKGKEEIMTLNLNHDGLSLLETENTPHNNYIYSNTHENNIKKNFDSSNINENRNYYESANIIYKSNFNHNSKNLENNFYNLLKNQPSFRSVSYNCNDINCLNEGICYMGKCICSNTFYGKKCEKSLFQKKKLLKKSKGTNLKSINIEKKYQKFLNSDPSLLRLQNYISQQLKKDNLIESFKNSKKLKKVSDFRFKSRVSTILNKNETLTKHTFLNKTNTKPIFNPCFNKGFYDKHQNINGLGNFDKCQKYILNFFFTNKTNETNSINLYQKSNVDYINKTKVFIDF